MAIFNRKFLVLSAVSMFLFLVIIFLRLTSEKVNTDPNISGSSSLNQSISEEEIKKIDEAMLNR